MKKNFDKCLSMLLHHEGGFVNHVDDPGGATNLGVTQKVYEEWVGHKVTIEDMKNLDFTKVAPIYRKNYFDGVRFDDLPSGVDWSVVDWGVNSGPGRAAKALQRIIGSTADGAIGPKTLQAVADMEPRDIIEKMHDARQRFYERLSTFETFGRGWTRRNKETLEQSLRML